MAAKTMRPAVAVGDAHGEYYSFAAVLIHAGLMDAELNWTGGRSIFIQLGDILDRGADPLQIDKLLDLLQPAARAAGGDIIRLVGNHELEILRKNYFITSLPHYQIGPFRAKIIQDILSGAWQAAYCRGGFLFTHAGVCDGLYEALKRELGPRKPTCANIAALINKIFRKAVSAGNYKHPIFNVSRRRGGADSFGGIFWEDLSALFAAHGNCPFRQGVGHTMVPQITVSESRRITAADTVMKNVFAGGFEYLEIKGRHAKIIKITGD
jgi:hypothetical protein